MSNSTVSNIWIEHMKVGAWMDGPMTGLTFSGMRIRDTTADGINFHGGVTNSTVTNSNIRNTGDDGIATWADSGIGADSGDTISNNTVQLQQLANGIAIYGGNNNTVSGNLVVDTGITQGGGIQVGQRFSSTPVGLTTISNNTMIRDGSLDPNWQFGVGALWFDGSQGAVTGPINVSNALIEQSPFEAIQWVEGTVSGVNLNNVSIVGTGTFALQEQTGGTATATNVTATGVAQANAGNAPSYSCEGSGFTITDDGGNSGISPAGCSVGVSPPPVYPPYPVTGVNASPTALTFSPTVVGSTSAAQTVTVANPTSAAASVSSITASGPFAETNNCGSSIAANGSCTVSVTYSPTASRRATGSVTINAGGVTNTVSLSGTGTAPGPVLSASPASLSFPATLVGSSPATQTVTVTNTGTTAATVSSVAVTGAFSQTNNCTTLAVNGSCTVTVKFTPTAATNTGTLTVNSNANNNPLTVGLSGAGITSTTNIALNKPVTASSDWQSYVPANVTDGNTSSYWESTDGAAYPQTITVDLGSTQSIGSVTLDLPPASAWSTRTETLSVLGSTNGTTFSQLVGSAGYTFNPSTGNTVTISLPSGTSDRYVELSFTGNTGWSAAQLSEFEVFPGGGSSGGPGALTASPSSESFGNENVGSTSSSQSVTVTNPGTTAASMSSIGVTGPFSRVQQLRHLARGGRLLHGQRDVRADRGRLGDRDAVGQQQRPGQPADRGAVGHRGHHQHQPGAQRPGHRVQLHPGVRARQRHRREHQHLLGRHNGAWPTTFTVNLGPRRPCPHRRPAAVLGLVDQNPDPVGPGIHQRHQLQHAGRLRHLHLEPVHRQHRHHPAPVRHQGPVRGAQLHRQQRPERRPGLRTGALRAVRRRL